MTFFCYNINCSCLHDNYITISYFKSTNNMTKDDKENKNKNNIKDSIFAKINKVIMNEKDDIDDKYIIDAKSDNVVDRVTLSKKAISEDTLKARDFLKNLSSQKNLGKPEGKNQSKEVNSFAKKILEERGLNKNKNPKDKGR